MLLFTQNAYVDILVLVLKIIRHSRQQHGLSEHQSKERISEHLNNFLIFYKRKQNEEYESQL